MKSCIDLGITCDICPLYQTECFPPRLAERYDTPADTEAFTDDTTATTAEADSSS